MSFTIHAYWKVTTPADSDMLPYVTEKYAFRNSSMFIFVLDRTGYLRNE